VENILELLKKINGKINIYMYGSKVYGCTSPQSDNDFIVVTNGTEQGEQYHLDNIEITIYGQQQFQRMIDEHEITALECLFLKPDYIITQTKRLPFKLDLQKLRESFARKSSNSWAKANKKLSIEKDFNPYIAKKSLFHSFRILYFGIQIALYGKIVDYQEANWLYYEIMNNPSEKWEDYKQKYQPLYNEIRSKFREVCPK